MCTFLKDVAAFWTGTMPQPPLIPVVEASHHHMLLLSWSGTTYFQACSVKHVDAMWNAAYGIDWPADADEVQLKACCCLHSSVNGLTTGFDSKPNRFMLCCRAKLNNSRQTCKNRYKPDN